MKVRDKAVNALKFIAGVNKNACPIVIFSNLALRLTYGFKRATAGRADCDDPASVLLRFVYNIRRFGRNHIVLGVHFVLLDIFRLNGTEGANADMESYKTYLYALVLDFLQKLGSEMQACRRCGCRAKLL